MTSLPRVGQTLGGARLQQLVAKGGHAMVFRALEIDGGRPVVVKIVQGSDPQVTRRFLREMKILAGLRHANVVSILDSGQNGSLLWYATLDTGAVDLSAWTARDRQVPAPPVKLRVLSDVLDGLSVIHSLGIIHRDLKPANVLVLPDGSAQVADFGLALPAGATPITEPDQVVGTVLYLTPEQLRQEPLDLRSDLYQWALIAFWLYAGELPFKGEPPLSRSLRRCMDPIPALSSECPALPSRLSDLIQRNLSPNPDWRHQSAGDLAEDLRTVRWE